MEWVAKHSIKIETVKACEIIVSLLTDDEKELIAITLNDQKITAIEQLCSRWWDQVPVADNAFVFRSQAAQILATNKRWIKLLSKLKDEDFLMKLIDPESYKETQAKKTIGKTTDKRQIDTLTDNINLVKTIGRSISGTGGTNRDTEYGSKWDKSDRKRLDDMKIKRPDKPLTAQETGQEDDTRGTDEEEMPKPTNVDDWINKTEALDNTHVRYTGKDRLSATFSDDYEEIEEKKIDLFDLDMNHTAGSTMSDNAMKSDTLVDAQKRQGFLTLRERIVLSDAINNIHNVEFIDCREKFFKLFDPLFRKVEKLCR